MQPPTQLEGLIQALPLNHSPDVSTAGYGLQAPLDKGGSGFIWARETASAVALF